MAYDPPVTAAAPMLAGFFPASAKRLLSIGEVLVELVLAFVFMSYHRAVEVDAAVAQAIRSAFSRGPFLEQRLQVFLAPGQSFQVVAAKTRKQVLSNQGVNGQSRVIQWCFWATGRKPGLQTRGPGSFWRQSALFPFPNLDFWFASELRCDVIPALPILERPPESRYEPRFHGAWPGFREPMYSSKSAASLGGQVGEAKPSGISDRSLLRIESMSVRIIRTRFLFRGFQDDFPLAVFDQQAAEDSSLVCLDAPGHQRFRRTFSEGWRICLQ